MINYFASTLVLISLLINVAALAPIRNLIALLPPGTLRSKWLVMAGLVLFFIAGYLGYIVMLWNERMEWRDLPIPAVFFCGAIFVRSTIALSLQTALDLRRIDALETENITDPLTQVYNRRYMDRRLQEEVERSGKYALGLSILLLDIDHFKRINDTYGHQVGDAVLASTASLIKSALRDLDVISRYGGEEFVVICTNTDIEGASLIADRLRKLVEAQQIGIIDACGASRKIRITVSIGAAELCAGDDSPDKLVQAADCALYKAKESGRNRVISAMPEARKSAPQYAVQMG